MIRYLWVWSPLSGISTTSAPRQTNLVLIAAAEGVHYSTITASNFTPNEVYSFIPQVPQPSGYILTYGVVNRTIPFQTESGELYLFAQSGRFNSGTNTSETVNVDGTQFVLTLRDRETTQTNAWPASGTNEPVQNYVVSSLHLERADAYTIARFRIEFRPPYPNGGYRFTLFGFGLNGFLLSGSFEYHPTYRVVVDTDAKRFVIIRRATDTELADQENFAPFVIDGVLITR